ncbi:MAG: hypothetical protein KFW09_04805 [Oscillospiraceae bacterium]|nr:hypothetical protein [Oscillospiraceae bacterium]
MSGKHDDDDDDDDSLLTSDGLFEIMKSLCDASNNKTPLDIKIFKPVAKNIPYLKNVTDRFNSNIYNMRGSYHNDMSLSIYIKDLKKICVRICTTLKQTYPSIYPAPQILTLIQSNRSNLACLPLLEHEEKIQELIFAFKKYINTYYRDVMKKVTISNLRLNNITKHIINVEEGYKKLYNLE